MPDLVPKYMVTVGTRWYLLGLAAAPLYQRVPTSPNSHKHNQDSNSLGGTIDLQLSGGLQGSDRVLRCPAGMVTACKRSGLCAPRIEQAESKHHADHNTTESLLREIGGQMQLSMANLDFGHLTDRRAKRAVSYRLRTLADYDPPSAKDLEEVERPASDALGVSRWHEGLTAQVN